MSITLSKELVELAEKAAKEHEVSVSEQIEHWALVGQLMEDNPDVTYEMVMGEDLEEAQVETN